VGRGSEGTRGVDRSSPCLPRGRPRQRRRHHRRRRRLPWRPRVSATAARPWTRQQRHRRRPRPPFCFARRSFGCGSAVGQGHSRRRVVGAAAAGTPGRLVPPLAGCGADADGGAESGPRGGDPRVAVGAWRWHAWASVGPPPDVRLLRGGPGRGRRGGLFSAPPPRRRWPIRWGVTGGGAATRSSRRGCTPQRRRGRARPAPPRTRQRRRRASGRGAQLYGGDRAAPPPPPPGGGARQGARRERRFRRPPQPRRVATTARVAGVGDHPAPARAKCACAGQWHHRRRCRASCFRGRPSPPPRSRPMLRRAPPTAAPPNRDRTTGVRETIGAIRRTGSSTPPC